MAANSRRLFPLQQAKVRRGALSPYLSLDGSRYLLGAIVILCLVSLLMLAQTGLVATKGYALEALEVQRTELLRERSQLQSRLAAAQSLTRVERRAAELWLRPAPREQIRYIVLPETNTRDAALPRH